MRASEQDGIWAWRLGLRYGAWHPEPNTDLAVLGKAWIEYADPHLNEVTLTIGQKYFGIWHEGPGEQELSENQITLLRPVLEELSQTATYAFEAAINCRRSMIHWAEYDPRINEPDDRNIADFAGRVNAFLHANPDLKFHLNTRLRVEGQEPEPASTEVSAPRPEPPAAQPYGVSHAGAEHYVAAWMRHLGALDAQPTKVSGDGGIDVVSRSYIAQVKNLGPAAAVPVAHIRDLAGVASVDRRKAAMFTSGVCSTGGSEFADRAGIALFRYDAVRGWLGAVNDHARKARRDGMG
ncbi:restriction endonuclease [Microbacterium sp. 2FI]|uniref:restriction endonuclease n=1 Tax=Microbacterium sp. 2FI TaxID=2502193 RepID=UPI0010F5F5B4|nr:restriction endonuclease [Microbacterium sp. 2FI]